MTEYILSVFQVTSRLQGWFSWEQTQLHGTYQHPGVYMKGIEETGKDKRVRLQLEQERFRLRVL